MRHTLKAVFADRGMAQQALDALRAAGFPDNDAVLVTVTGARQASGPNENAAPAWRKRTGTSISRLLSRLFGLQDASRMAAAGHGTPDSHILTLAALSEPDARRAASLLSAFIRADGKAPPASASDGYHHARDAGHCFGIRDEARMGYRFGHDMHNTDRYRNRSWNEANADLELLWNARNGAANWEESEAAVHLGWDSTSPEIDDDDYHRSHWRTSYAHRALDAGAQPAHGLPAPAAADEPGAVWKQRHPGELPPWERFVDAVRHGWGRISFGMDGGKA